MEHISSWSHKDANLLGESITTLKKNMQVLFYASNEVGLEAETEKIRYAFMSHHQNVGQNHKAVIANKSFKIWQSSNVWKQH
jgi:pectate lyase